MFLAAYDLLKTAGYISIGLDHYVLPGDELDTALVNRELHRNFQGYCTRRTTGQVYAFGVSAISQLEKGYFQNTRDIPAYVDAIGKGMFAVERGYMLNENQRIIRQVITGLMCNKRLNWREQAAMYNVEQSVLRNILRVDEGRLQEFARDGLITLTEEEIGITEPGSLFIRNIAASIDPAFTEQFHRYSKSV
jgi:oxygen-independent coproporphyrinogen-3 oxidase